MEKRFVLDNEKMQFSNADLEQLKKRGSDKEKIIEQIAIFKKGIPFVNLDRAALIGDGLKRIPNSEYKELFELFTVACQQGRITKFVPASGAATRMFKNLLYFFHKYDKISLKDLKDKTDEKKEDLEDIFKTLSELKQFAFYDDLKNVLKKDGLSLEELITNDSYEIVMDYLLTDKGLNYADNPKAFLKFHRYGKESRNSFEEHIVEGIEYARDKDGKIRLHFTLSEKYIDQEYLLSILKNYENNGKNKFQVSYSIQKSSTDTIAVDELNRPFRDEQQKLVLRPGGHGALIENLNELDADIVFIKNIDNVVPDSKKGDTYKYKKLLAGYLIKLQQQIFDYIKKLKGNNDHLLPEIKKFMETELFISFNSEFSSLSTLAQKNYIITKLDRPIRICGMVKNEGEPGGGPFWVKNSKNVLSLQIVEGAQIDKNNDSQLNILNSSTHFNPVDLICGIKDYKNERFDLRKFIDQKTAFISRKSKNGKALKALELPGLWNGAMADWTTIFVEVPLSTFNPVKTINDLLRNEHRQ